MCYFVKRKRKVSSTQVIIHCCLNKDKYIYLNHLIVKIVFSLNNCTQKVVKHQDINKPGRSLTGINPLRLHHDGRNSVKFEQKVSHSGNVAANRVESDSLL